MNCFWKQSFSVCWVRHYKHLHQSSTAARSSRRWIIWIRGAWRKPRHNFRAAEEMLKKGDTGVPLTASAHNSQLNVSPQWRQRAGPSVRGIFLGLQQIYPPLASVLTLECYQMFYVDCIPISEFPITWFITSNYKDIN